MVRHAPVLFVTAAVALAGCGNAGPDEPVGRISSAITFPNDQPAFDYFLGKGLTSFQAAGIVGNLDQESGVDPTAVQSGGPGRGIAQWSVGGRWDTDPDDNAVWYAGTLGQNVESLQLQLDFIWYELTTFSSYGLTALQQTTNVTDATIVFETDFEGCGTCDQSQRVAYAENVLAAFGSDTVDAGPLPDAGASTPCTVTATGESGECMSTSACAALGNHVSTPGYCPGAADIQCCTAKAGTGGMDAGTTKHEDAGTPRHEDAGLATSKADAGKSGAKHDAGASAGAIDAARPEERADATADQEEGGGAGSTGGGCATAPTGGRGSCGGILVAGSVWIVVGRRRRR
jgi:hypothetical protein